MPNAPRRLQKLACWILLSFSAAFVPSDPVQAQQREPFKGSFANLPYKITAVDLSYEQERDLYEAKGMVRIEQAGRVMTADWVLFSGTSRVGVAAGNVVIRDAGDVVQADFAWVDLETLRILGTRATVD